MRTGRNYYTSSWSSNTTAIVFDDHRMFAESFACLVERMDSFACVESFCDEKELIHFLLKTDTRKEIFLFIDYYLKDKHSIPLINEVKRLNKNTQVIIVSSVENAMTISYIDSVEPEGFLSKISGFDEIVACIHAINDGKRYVSPFIKQILDDNINRSPVHFTRREIELLQYFYQGHSILSTAEQISLSIHTIVSHRRRMMEKAKCKSMAELLVFCRKNGFVGDAGKHIQ